MRVAPFALVLLSGSLLALGLAPSATAETNCSSPLPQDDWYLFDCGTNLGFLGVGTTLNDDCFNVRFHVLPRYLGYHVLGDDPCPA